MPAALNLLGQRFGMLIVVERLALPRKVRWVCACDCGGVAKPTTENLRSGNSKSCGCRKRNVLGESTIKHGLHGHELYIVWKAMNQRCHNPANKGYKNYGARGITVCDEWRGSFAAFLRDMGDRPKGTTLERLDNNGPYSPSNCKWATRSEQANNTRRTKHITFNGVTMSTKQWARELRKLGVSEYRFYKDIKRFGREGAVAKAPWGTTINIEV